MNVKDMICTAIGVIGGAIASAFGGWNAALLALIICMAVDYITGIIVALVFHNSPKSTGKPNGRADWHNVHSGRSRDRILCK